MSERLPFRPVIGTDSKILNSVPTAGYVWFATDTKKIYYSDGKSFLSMGGNTGIYYGNLKHPEDEDTNRKEFEFLLENIDGNAYVQDGNYKRPNIDDLILNIPDGCFYRVTNVLDNNTKFIGLKLTIAGSGSSNTGGSTHPLIIADADNGSFKRYFTQDATKAFIDFTVTPITNLENNSILRITYKIAGLSDIIVDDNIKNFGTHSFNLAPYLSRMSTSSTTRVSINVEDLYGGKGTADFYVSVIKLTLTSNITRSILTTSDENREIAYECTPSGGSTLSNRQVKIQFFDSADNHLVNHDVIENIAIANNPITPIVKVPTIGVYTMKVIYVGSVGVEQDSQQIFSNALTYKVVAYDENPQLVVGIPPKHIEQYSTINIGYMIAMVTDDIEKVKVSLTVNGKATIKEVNYNELNDWSIYFDKIGTYDLSISALGVTEILPTISVQEYTGKIPVIYNTGLTLNFSAVNRSNTEVDKDKWISTGSNQNVGFKFDNFAWGNINGWQKDEDGIDMLHLSSGAKIELLDYSPYRSNAMTTGQTIELDFMVSGVTDFSKPLIKCLSYKDENTIQVGFNITGQESTLNTGLIKATGASIIEGDEEENQSYNTAIQGLTAKFIENKRIHLTWVVESKNNKYPMIKTYLNGVLSGITQYISAGTSADDFMSENINRPARLILDSTYGNINIYNIRIYEKSVLNSNIVIDNYIATYGTTEEKAHKYEDNVNVLDSQNNISISTIETAHDNYGYKLSIPYIKISGGTALTKNDENGNYYKKANDTTQGLPTAKKDYRTVDEMVFIDHNGNRPEFTQKSIFKDDGSFNGIVMYGQGTSSMEYPVKNLRFKSKLKVNDEKFLFTVNDNEVDLVCLKVDYMESSGSHNTGTGNLVQMLLEGIDGRGIKTPGQEYWTDKTDYKVLTAIQGFPVAVFYKNSNEPNAPYEFIGKGNFNLDKATHEPFGFMNDPEEITNINEAKFGWDENDGTNNIKGTVEQRPKYISPEDEPIINSIHCYEFLNNASNLANFLGTENETFEQSFFKTVDSDGDSVPNWFTSYESRYPEGDADDGSDINIAPFYKLCSWLNSTSQTEATNTPLEESYTGLDGVVYTADTSQYRLAKFKKEFESHLNKDFTAFYYILTHVLLMIDSRAKNMMLATWGPEEGKGEDYIWYPIFYDMDTMLGLNNYGYNKFNYDIEDTADNVYNGHKSVLWNNWRDAFPEYTKSFYQKMQNAGLTYEVLLNNYNKNQADAANENIYNADAWYKYIRPFSEPYVGGDGNIVNPGTKDFLYAGQGSRSMHREWWLFNRINYFNGKHLSEQYKTDKYEMRIYTPSATINYYYAGVLEPLKEEFDQGLYYINEYEGQDEEPKYVLATVWNEEIIYYKKIEITDKLAESLSAVPPNNDYTLTPLYNQYISVAYGGTNGQTTEPTYVKANTPQRIAAPAGANYNDTETYIYGGSMLKDLGDLSYQYLGAFRFPEKETKLESLTLGNANNKYYNPNFSSLTIEKQAPYLANLNIMNCIGLKGRALNLSGCQNLKRLLATGTDLTSVSLASYGVLNELRLPDTISTLAIDNQTNLNDNYFTIGKYDSDTEQYTYTGGKNIIILDIQNTPINTYRIIKDCEAALQRIRVIGFNWTIGTEQSDDIDINNSSIQILDILNRDSIQVIDNNLGLSKKQTIVGTITLKTELGLTINQAMSIYNKYINDFPNINFVFEGLDIYDVNILDGNNNVYWTKKVKRGDTITKDFLSSGPKGEFKIPIMLPTIQYEYIFNNKWNVLDIDGNDTNVDINGSQDEETFGWPISSEYHIGGTIYLKPDFSSKLQQYTITITNIHDNNFKYSGTFEYGYSLKQAISELESGRVPYQDDKNLDFDKTYRFVGYNTDSTLTTPLVFGDDYIVSGSKEYYAIFNIVSVYDNAYPDYYTYSTVTAYNDDDDISFSTSGVYITGVTKELKGKITIPAKVNIGSSEQPVIGIGQLSHNNVFKSNINITHVFFEKNNSIRIINDGTFTDASNLKYVEFPESLRVIGAQAFARTGLRPDPNIDSPSFKLNNSLYRIGDTAFNAAFSGYRGALTFFIPSSVQRMDRLAISYLDTNNASLVIGSPESLSKLNFAKSISGDYKIIGENETGNAISTIEFYSELYNAEDLDKEIVVGQYGKALLRNVIGENVDTVNVY